MQAVNRFAAAHGSGRIPPNYAGSPDGTRYIQQMLGHSDMGTTALYTQVAIRKLQEIHAQTHPARAERSLPEPE